ncbi:MAG: zinc ribbon domain-containing protein [Waterburya sp.]
MKQVITAKLKLELCQDQKQLGCSKCGHVSQQNRPNKGLIFICVACKHTLHSDLVGARNVALRMLLLRQDFKSTRRISAVPDVSHEETKANYLPRFLELRWSADTMPTFSISKVG